MRYGYETTGGELYRCTYMYGGAFRTLQLQLLLAFNLLFTPLVVTRSNAKFGQPRSGSLWHWVNASGQVPLPVHAV